MILQCILRTWIVFYGHWPAPIYVLISVKKNSCAVNSWTFTFMVNRLPVSLFITKSFMDAEIGIKWNEMGIGERLIDEGNWITVRSFLTCTHPRCIILYSPSHHVEPQDIEGGIWHSAISRTHTWSIDLKKEFHSTVKRLLLKAFTKPQNKVVASENQ
jgi:hypothetical protein